MFRRSRFFSLALAGTLLLAGISGEAQARSRIKDIVEFEGVRDNMTATPVKQLDAMLTKLGLLGKLEQ
jgi:hypothetical protein